MIVIRNKITKKYMGGINRKTGNHIACDNCYKAKKYSTKNRAIAALKSMGYFDHSDFQFLEVEYKNSGYPLETQRKIIQLDNECGRLNLSIDAAFRENQVDMNKVQRLRNEKDVINAEMKKLVYGEDV